MNKIVGEAPQEQSARAVEKYLSQSFVASDQLKAQYEYERMKKDPKTVDWNRVNDNETLYISSLFDLREWWLNVGFQQHREIYFVVPSIIAVPGSNAFQERVFSACTFFDDVLRQRLSDMRFEMSVLIAVNENLLNETESVTEERADEIVQHIIDTFEKSDESFLPEPTAALIHDLDAEIDYYEQRLGDDSSDEAEHPASDMEED